MSMGNGRNARPTGFATWQDAAVRKVEPEELSTFGGRLAAAMRAKPITGLALGSAADVDQGYISKLRSGERQMPNGDIVERLAMQLGVQGAWLARGTGPRERVESASTPTKTERIIEPPRGHAALEVVLQRIAWPEPFDVTAADKATAQARSEAFGDGSERPESTWHQRLLQLYRENTGRAKAVPRPVHDETPDERDARELATEKGRRAAAKAERATATTKGKRR